MLNLEKNRVILLNPVRKNMRLSKFQDLNKKQVEEEFDNRLNVDFTQFGDFVHNPFVYNGCPYPENGSPTFLNRLLQKFVIVKTFYRKVFGKNISDEEFFNNVKSGLNELEKKSISENKKEFSDFLKKSVSRFQVHTLSKINKDGQILEYETTLFNAGIKKYIEEKDFIDFVKQVEAGMALIEIEFFGFEIPENVLEKVEEADKLKVFDNFYVLYTEPNKELIKKEKEKVGKVGKVEKDPIIFGVIQNSSKLYYIADWVTDYCKLTLENLTNDFNIVVKQLESNREFLNNK